eukprot:1158025-Pelagomonas_calceolata.AAC.3
MLPLLWVLKACTELLVRSLKATPPWEEERKGFHTQMGSIGSEVHISLLCPRAPPAIGLKSWLDHAMRNICLNCMQGKCEPGSLA